MPAFRIDFIRKEPVESEEGVEMLPPVEGTIDVEEESERAARRFVTQFDVEIASCREIDFVGADEAPAPKKKS